MLFALLPAAGHSRRMGRPKLNLPLGERTVLEQVIATLRSAGVERILVVVGPHVPGLVTLAEGAGAKTFLLPDETPDMRSTIEQGLNWIEMNWRPTADDAFLLVPADHPALDGSVVRQLVEASTSGSILVPTFENRRGHPTLIGWRHVPGIRALPVSLGLNAYLRAHVAETREIPVATKSVLLDLDTPADYEQLLQRWRGHSSTLTGTL